MAARELTAKQKLFCASYLGAARFNATEAARLAGYKGNENTLKSIGCENLTKPDIKAEIEAWRAELRHLAIASMEYRVARLQELEQKYFDLIDARAVALKNETAGGGTGLLVRQTKVLGAGASAEKVTEYAADTAVTKEIRELYKQVAQELGQWISRSDNSTKISIEIQEMAERVAGELGLDPTQVIAEAQAIIAGSR